MVSRIRRNRIKWAVITAILLSGVLLLSVIIVAPRISWTMREEQDRAHSIKAVMADLRYERRIKLIRQELDTLKESGQYTALFLSMYSIDSYDTYWLSHWRGLETFKAEMIMENGRELAGTLAYLRELDAVPDTVLLGLDPECLEEEYPLEDSLLKMVKETPETEYEILLVNPAVEYFRAKSEEEQRSILNRYEKAARLCMQEENVKVYFACDREWLVCNNGNYQGDKALTEDVATALLAYYTRDEYRLTWDDIEERMEDARELIDDWRGDDRMLEDMRDWTLVFIGDSTYGNFSGSLAVTGVVEAFTGAKVLNCGYGGMAAAYGNPEHPEATAMGDLLKVIEEGGSEITALRADSPAVLSGAGLRESVGQGENTVFFIAFGINDYINAIPVSSDDRYACDTYMGAMRTGIEKLRDMFPLGRIVLQTPNFMKYNGFGTIPTGEAENVFEDYVDAVEILAEEYGLTVLDFYRELGIDRDNYAQCLADEIHLNEASRFDMAMHILENLR